MSGTVTFRADADKRHSLRKAIEILDRVQALGVECQLVIDDLRELEELARGDETIVPWEQVGRIETRLHSVDADSPLRQGAA